MLSRSVSVERSDNYTGYMTSVLHDETSSSNSFNLLKPTGHVMHQQFNIQQYIYVFYIYLRTNSDLCHLQYKLIGFYNRDEKCLLRGMNWVFK